MLAGERVTLRRVEPGDYPLIQRWQNDPEVFPWMDYDHPFSLADIERSEADAAESGVPFVVELDGRPVGRIGLNQFRHRHGVASLYLFVGERDAWGRGVAPDALRTLLAFAFDHLNLRMVQLWTLADNERAIRLYKGFGFREDARLRDRSVEERGTVDHVWMSITRDEHAAARNGS